MSIDYLGVMLVNLGAGLALLAHYLYMRPTRENRRVGRPASWRSAFSAWLRPYPWC